MSEKLRVASVGLGWWSDVLADAAVRSDHVEIAGCFTRSADKRAAFADTYKCKNFSTFEEVLADDSIDAIINTTPNHVHLETTAQAAKAGKHVFLDKPVANTIAEAQAITKVCRDEGVVLSVGYQRRRESHFRWIQDKIKAGDFGILVQAEANISRDREGQTDVHPAGVAFYRGIQEPADLGEVDDGVELLTDLGPLHPQDRAVEEDVFSPGQLGVELGADEVGVVTQLKHLHDRMLRMSTREDQTRFF